MIRVLFVPVGKPPEVREINEDSLESMQRLVGGYIEPIQLGDDVVAIVNEEGRLLGLPQNRAVPTARGCREPFVGDFFLCRLNRLRLWGGTEFASLPQEEIDWWTGALR